MVKKYVACDNREHRSNIISFHRFPSDRVQQHQWLKRLNRLDLKDVSNKRVCAVHFEASSFLADSKKKRSNATQSTKRRLKSDALPIEHVPTSRLIDSATQTDLDMISLSALFEKLTLFESNTITSMMNIERFKNDDNNINFFTGFRYYKIFKMVFELLQVRNYFLLIC
jgi:hypothetical protein